MTNRFAWRYFKARKNANIINIISWISVVAIAIVTAALVVVLSVFNGFEDLVRNLYSDFYCDIKVTAVKGKWFELPTSHFNELAKQPGVVSLQPVVEERAILVDESEKSIVTLKGVQPNYASVNGVARHIINGQFGIGDLSTPGIVLGGGVESALGISASKALYPITVYVPNRKATLATDPAQSLHSANVYPTGSFLIQQEFDNHYAISNIEFLRYLLDVPNDEVSALELYLLPGTNANAVANKIRRMLGQNYVVKTRFEQNQSLFVAMQMEKLIIFGVAFLILLIASFNIMTTLTMMVLEKKKDISVLMAMGLGVSSLQAIFVKLGIILASVGTLIGVLLGVLISLGQQKYHWVKLGGESFIIDHYPIELRWLDLVAIVAIVFTITLIASYIPARRSSIAAQTLRLA